MEPGWNQEFPSSLSRGPGPTRPWRPHAPEAAQMLKLSDFFLRAEDFDFKQGSDWM